MLGNALSAGLLVTTEGKSSASLGELSKRWFTLNVTVENLTDSSKNCEISALVGSDGYDEFTYSEIETAEEGEKTLAELFGKESNDRICFIDRFTPFEKATIFPGDENVELNSANGGAYDFRLGARESMTFELTFMIDEETFLKYNDIFENGFFVEGFVSVRSGDEEASLPFAGFLGDASDAPTVDAMIGSTAVYDNTYFWRDYSSDTFGRITLGRDPFSGEESRMFISTSADPTTASVKLHLGLLRSISDVRIKVTKDGETVSEREIGYLPATYLDYTTNMLISPEITIWNCRADDNYYYIYPDGEYEISISYKKLKGGREETLNFSLTLDSTPPEVVAHEFTDDGKLKLEVYDESGISAITICDEYGSVAERDEKGCYDISAFSKYVYVELYDEAMNFRAVRYLKPITENE